MTATSFYSQNVSLLQENSNTIARGTRSIFENKENSFRYLGFNRLLNAFFPSLVLFSRIRDRLQVVSRGMMESLRNSTSI